MLKIEDTVCMLFKRFESRLNCGDKAFLTGVQKVYPVKSSFNFKLNLELMLEYS
jgi:hypothetical protein